ncbi:hypothetical protein [Methanosphaera sp. BMS]|uniref:hypothetical protein n=1 Tax=Methanosphaera sp. BMS TaxID=1789762 RepID=UPI000DC1CCE8|nr:hypothetical protein [Methanosphaera sp. BMS]AWX31833.1 hypothetical protein AW729_01445 [Methanosphaera sp. BMS]
MNTCYYCNCEVSDDKKVCANCNKKINAVKILKKYPKIKDHDYFTKNHLIQEGIVNPITIQYNLQTLEEVGLLFKNYDVYHWKNKKVLEMYIQKYSENDETSLNLSNMHEYGWVIYKIVDKNVLDIHVFKEFELADEFKKSQENIDDYRFSRVKQLEEIVYYIINLKKFYVNKNEKSALKNVKLYNQDEISQLYENNFEQTENLTFIKEIKYEEVIKRLKEFIQNTIEEIDRPTEDTYVSLDDIYNNFSLYLKNRYNEKISKKDFNNYFTSLLFQTYPYVDRFHDNNRTYFNIKLNYVEEEDKQKTNKNENIHILSEDEDNNQRRLSELLDKLLKKSETKQIHYNDLYTTLKERLMKEYQLKLEQDTFFNTLNKFTHENRITKQIIDGKITYNLEIISEEDITDTIETEETENIETDLLTKEYAENTLIIIKCQIEINKYDTLLDLLYYTRKYTDNISIHKVNSEKMDVTIELTVNNEDKEELFETIKL